jgi:molecular chaperone GrpE
MHTIHPPIPKNASHIKEKEKNADKDEQVEALNDKYLRLMAEFENYKRRSGREKERLIEAADELLIKELVEVRENFERAFTSKDRGETFANGMKLNCDKLNSILQKHGLEAYGERGEKFDPELHEGLICGPNDSIPDSHISEVLERGYTLKGKIIKHAKVAVSSGHALNQIGPDA